MTYLQQPQKLFTFLGSDAVADVTSHGEKKMGRQITSKFTVITVLSVNSLNSEENHVQNTKSHGPSAKSEESFLSGNFCNCGNLRNLCTMVK